MELGMLTFRFSNIEMAERGKRLGHRGYEIDRKEWMYGWKLFSNGGE